MAFETTMHLIKDGTGADAERLTQAEIAERRAHEGVYSRPMGAGGADPNPATTESTPGPGSETAGRIRTETPQQLTQPPEHEYPEGFF